MPGQEAEGRFFVGAGSAGGWVWTQPGRALLVLGPPRSYKTKAVVMPNVALAPGAVVSTSTKTDVIEATVAHRSRRGTCWVYDPTGWLDNTGTVVAERWPGVQIARWSPMMGAERWSDALRTAQAIAGAARPYGATVQEPHWIERAGSLLACLIHAGAVSEGSMRQVMSWTNRREGAEALERIEVSGSQLAVERLAGILATDQRELSSIWSTASSVLAAYGTEEALSSTDSPNFDPADFASSTDTLYICAAGAHQHAVAPLVAGLVDRIALLRYAAHARGLALPPVVMALDEVANIAPLRELPAMASEGGGQGVQVLACLQDLSQARARWGKQADGFLTLFGAKLVHPGVSDVATLEALSLLGGDIDVTVRSVTRGGTQLFGGSTTVSTRRQRAMPPSAVRSPAPGHALYIEDATAPAQVGLCPWDEMQKALTGSRSRTPQLQQPPLRPPDRAQLGRSSPDNGRTFGRSG